MRRRFRTRLGSYILLAWALIVSGTFGLLFADAFGGNPWAATYLAWLPPLASLLSGKDGMPWRILRDPVLAGAFGGAVALGLEGSFARAPALLAGALALAVLLDRLHHCRLFAPRNEHAP